MRLWVWGWTMVWLSALAFGAMAEALIFNGSFQQDADGDGVPDGWTTAGRRDIQQELRRVQDPQRGWVVELRCTRFVAGTPDSHVMLAQVDRVGVQRGQWYRLRLWARSEGVTGVNVALVNRKVWASAGLEDSFSPEERWQPFEFFFQATQDLKPEESRFQIWFTSTGTLWVDDVELEPMPGFRRQWQPALPWEGKGNALPNSSFECGGAGWGCWSPDIPGWGGQVYRLLGQADEQRAFHGQRSWRLSLEPEALPVFYFDYFDPLERPVKALLLGHEGWVPLERGTSYVFSAYVQADRPNLPVLMVIQQAEGRSLQRTFSVGQDWTRVEMAFTAETDFACGFVGLDLRQAENPEGTLWLDALQWEVGTTPSPYRPREALESAVETERVGNIFLEPEMGLEFRLRAFNGAEAERTLRGTLTLTDFFDQVVWRREVGLKVPAGRNASLLFQRLMAGRRGFFRLRWEPEQGLPQTMRCALIEPSLERDSLFGMNHAFPWEFLLRLAHWAGVRWWRDWSVQWRIVQPQRDGFNFRVPDAQILRVLEAQGNVLVLLPFPSAPWATKPNMEAIQAIARNDYERQRMVVACKPERWEDFAAYVRASVERYRVRVRAFEILNEPVYTTYALPRRLGHNTADYVELLRVAYQAAKEVDPGVLVVGGIGGPPSLGEVREFVEQGGLRWCDVMDLHLYPHRGWPETYEEAFQELWERMKARGEAKPIWLTEFGCYGDDDPPFSPFAIGDAAMNRALRPNERQAASDLVRFAALFCAYGVRKIFYHAGTSAGLHQNDAGNVFFEYGGTPRKQYAAQAALARFLGPDVEFVRKWTEPEGIRAYEFRSRGRRVVILWARGGERALELPEGLEAFDIMGNPLPSRRVSVGETPLYLVGKP